MTASKLIVSVRCLSNDRIARFVSLAWLMVDRKYVVINISFEKLFSQLAILTHIVKNIRIVVLWLGSAVRKTRLPPHLIQWCYIRSFR